MLLDLVKFIHILATKIQSFLILCSFPLEKMTEVRAFSSNLTWVNKKDNTLSSST